ncbi:N-6 DNA methylase [Proteinivorax hydrogeniformans]|uniref:site-specific DNA-methyltransferase (adenine-specific) n=1 Tax=Proteinivorax hydrogeniformans TaxID=1826727 RepID=A0AAU8HRF2_9FIRM
MENNIKIDKDKLIQELKQLHKQLVNVYDEIFEYKFSTDQEFIDFIESQYTDEGIAKKDREAWNKNYCHRAAYTLLNKILFIRICEDKGFMTREEDYVVGELENEHAGQKLSKKGLEKWKTLITKSTFGELVNFAFADMKKSYNNISLYKQEKYDALNPTEEEFDLYYVDLEVDKRNVKLIKKFDDVLDIVIKKLGKDRNFKVIDSNILGDVYEKFMDRETRKAVGQFYTPEFVIEYILNNTVAEADVLENPFVTVADIACGSGHFLTMAYDILRRKFKDNLASLQVKYANEIYTIKKNGKDQEITGKQYWQEKNIHYHLLKNCIYGADIDSFAVQLATINLLLKDLDNFTDELNIIEADSLIRWEEEYDLDELKKELQKKHETVTVRQVNWLGEEEKRKVTQKKQKVNLKHQSGKVEVITKEKAKEVVKLCSFFNTTFEYVLGNPPYIRHEKIKNKTYLSKNYDVFNNISDIYTYFFERGMAMLNRNGKLGFITSNKFTRTNYGKELRSFLSNKFTIGVCQESCRIKIKKFYELPC